MFQPNVLRGRRASAASSARITAGENDFVKVLSVDLSPLELRFKNVFSRLAAIEKHLDLKQHLTEQQIDDKQGASVTAAQPPESEDEADESKPEIQTNPETPEPTQKIYTDGVTLAQEIESLRAAQLRLKIEHELANSTLQLEMATLRTDLEQGTATDLQEFREQVASASVAATKALQSECQRLAQTMNVTLAERQVAENRWKASFEDTIAARIQDIWSGLHSTSRKLQESLQFLQTEMVGQEESSREINAFVECMQTSSARLERDCNKHDNVSRAGKSLEHLHGMCAQNSVRLHEQDSKLTDQVGPIYQQMESAEARVLKHLQAYDAFVAATDKTFTALESDVTACNASLSAHDLVQRHSEDLVRVDERMATSDARIGSIDGRVALTDKKLTSTVAVIEEHYQERQQLVAAIQSGLNQAALERTAVKHNVSDLGFVVQEVQHKLLEVGKTAHTTELHLAAQPRNCQNCTPGDVQLSIRDVTVMIEDDRKTASTLRSEFDREVHHSVTRFTAAEDRDAQAQEAVANAAMAADDVKAQLEARIQKNGNLIHQLNTMVDSLAITETTEDMEDKMNSFALACAQLGLKLEFFGKKASSVDGCCVMKDDVKASLATLLTKVIRFLGSGVSIDQNKYLLTARRSQSVDPITGQITIEIPPQHVLESFRVAKAAAFTAKTRKAMDQLQPVLKTNRTSMDFRDAFERKLRFVLEFGLANLFPNMEKPKNPLNRRGGEFGTCIACDRPMDTDEPQTDPDESEIPVRHRAQHEVVAASSSQAVETSSEQRNASPKSRPSSAAIRNRIDTKTAVRGRSGSSWIRPKSGGDSVHNAPGTGEFVYRGGFRIPKTNSHTCMSASINSLINLSVQSFSSDKTEEINGDGLLDVDNSCLERVALVGKHQVEIPSVSSLSGAGNGAAAVRAARPHTAPLRMKSLPRLDVAAPTVNVTLD
ncbi:hypothetical protein GQ600_25866 [Phytophthora cactorum]|nr:hypothetical protein GQ600_25866 [Phytophthora cactorum]